MQLEIFNVEHGACALVHTSNGKLAMIDCGHNATTGWMPGDLLARRNVTTLDRLFVTNYDEDHVSGYRNLKHRVFVNILTRNSRVSPATIRQLKSEDGMGLGIEALLQDVSGTFTGDLVPADLDFGDTKFETFSNGYGPPPFGFNDENNLSLVIFVSVGTHRIIFPGDLEKAGWRAMLRDQHFVELLRGVNVFVASHHGRENGYCPEVFDMCAPEIVVISDQSHQYQSQETVDSYRSHTRGMTYNGRPRHVLTTRRDGYMAFDFPAQGDATVYLENGGV